MFHKKTVQLLNEPCMNRCWVCHNLKFAIASQVLIHKSSGYPYRRFICKDCGKLRGLNPTLRYLTRLREMDEGEETEPGLTEENQEMRSKVLAGVRS